MNPQVEPLKHLRDKLLHEMQRAIVGQLDAIEALIIALLAQGHVLIEGVPGTAKTLMVRTLGAALGVSFQRIQFTPDLMPSDVTGTHLYDAATSRFNLRKGPIFTDLLLADEINRAPAKTQSALLEAMQERQVSVDGTTHRLSEHFMVFATQNPVEHEGTYPLPEAELDRFLLKLWIDYPSAEEEDEILARASTSVQTRAPQALGVSQVVSAQELARLRPLALEVRVGDEVRHYIRDLVRATRRSPLIVFGAGPRAGLHLLVAARWAAALDGRVFVTPDDVQRMLPWVLTHRLVVSPDAEIDGLDARSVLSRAVRDVDVPR